MSASVAAAKPTKDLRYYSLDFWRGVACLMVVVLHSIAYVTENPAHIPGSFISRKIFSLLSQGFAGVPMFFVISGYCIAAACETAMSKELPARTYFFRRFKRIYPPYWIFLLGVVGLHLGLRFFGGADYLTGDIVPMTKPEALSAWQWLGTVTLTESWRDQIIGDKSFLFLPPLWSLCYEEQFYIVCGMAMVCGRKWFYRLLMGLSVVVFGIVMVNCAVVSLPVDGFFFDGRWLMFAAGVLVFYVLQFGDERSRKLALALLGLAFCISVAWVFKQRMTIPRQIVCSIPFAMLLILVFRCDRQIAESRVLRPISWCGVMCYSLYLIHLPITKAVSELCYRIGVQGEWSTLFITIPASIAASVSAAWAFHLLVERKFMNTPPSKSRESKLLHETVPIPVSVAD